jgi:hypothetical protein
MQTDTRWRVCCLAKAAGAVVANGNRNAHALALFPIGIEQIVQFFENFFARFNQIIDK